MMRSPTLVSGLEDRATRLRIHSIRATTTAGSGHPTSCCSAADILAVLFFDVMRFRPDQPDSRDSDRFVLSKGHAAPLLYAAWAEAGGLDPRELASLRRIDSPLEGHPTPRARFVPAATGSLGQGLSLGLGMALAARLDGVPRAIFVLLGDGECAEGNVWEAAQLARHYRLDNLVAIVDVNRLGQSQATMLGHNLLAYQKRFEAFGWRAVVVDGHDIRQLIAALRWARRRTGRPMAILARTVKGKGIPDVEDRDDWHGRPLDPDMARRTVAYLEGQLNGAKLPGPHPPEPQAAPAVSFVPGPIPLPAPLYGRGEEVAIPQAYGEALTALGALNPAVVALDGDVKNSTYAQRFREDCPERFFECFIAEQNMVAMAAGLAVSGRIPFASSFACFLSRAYDQVRMAAISRANLKLCGSHAGVSIGKDGPSQMGLEDLAMLRAIPESVILYPADAVCAARCVELAAGHPGIVYIRTTRPRTPVLYDPQERFEVGGLKVLRRSDADRVTVVAAGITLHEALAAWEALGRQGIPMRVIDLYSVKPVDRAGLAAAARATGGRVVTVEDHYPEGGLGAAVLEAVADAGFRVRTLAVRDLPRSGDPATLMERAGISARCIAQAVHELLGVAASVPGGR